VKTSAIIEASKRLINDINTLSFSPPVAFLYNPLEYAWEPYEQYLTRYAAPPKKTVFFGMNPGPWGMGQTGVPFGEVENVKTWLGIEGPVGKPDNEHPSRPVYGFACHRSEVSGKRVWGLMRRRFGVPETFFHDHFIANYCPLLFFDQNGRNITPDKLRKEDKKQLFHVCDRHAAAILQIFSPTSVIGIGKFAYTRVSAVCTDKSYTCPEIDNVISILHPSPANPKANKGWAKEVEKILEDAGIWLDESEPPSFSPIA
jgi:single-strand selective monofunctional uracil DNA glycosylase